MDAINTAIKAAGGPQRLANVLMVSIQRIVNWRRRGRIPAEWVIPVERAVDGAVNRHELRPDLYPEPPQTAASHADRQAKELLDRNQKEMPLVAKDSATGR